MQPAGRLIKLATRSQAWRRGEPAPEAPSRPSALPSAAVRVLLVEDQPGDAKLITYILGTFRAPVFTVTHVDRLSRAIEFLGGGAPVDVVLLDLSLPDSSGLETVARMQAAAPHVPLVIMTGRDDPAFADTALEAGAQDYLVKSDNLEQTVGRAIRYAITRMHAQIERQSLVDNVALHQRRLVQELEAARTMQFDLLPRPEQVGPRLAEMGLEAEAFFEPSSGIGGDLWGCLDCGHDRMAFYTFDFSGHGIGAALNVFRFHALIAERWDRRRDPAETLRGLGTALCGLVGRGQFATMFLAIVNTARNELAWASAGSPAPLMVEGGACRLLEAHGQPLGLSRTPEYTTRREDFRPGASLLLYSDAITEAATTAGPPLGEAGLMRLVSEQLAADGRLSVDRLLDRFFHEARTPIEDDLTAIRVSHLGRGAA